MTPSQAKSPSAPEAIEDQQQSGGPPRPLSLVWGTGEVAILAAGLGPEPTGQRRR